MKRNSIRVALQKKGRLKQPSVEYLRALGLEVTPSEGNHFISRCANADVEVMYVRHGDVPQYVQSGVADFGLVGGNVLHEDRFKVKLLRKLDYGHCLLVVAVPNGSAARGLADLEGERIATSYPNSLRRFLSERHVNASLITIRGSVEIAPELGLADAICDLTETGNTLRDNDLKAIETLIGFQCCLIESPIASRAKRLFGERFLEAGDA